MESFGRVNPLLLSNPSALPCRRRTTAMWAKMTQTFVTSVMPGGLLEPITAAPAEGDAT